MRLTIQARRRAGARCRRHNLSEQQKGDSAALAGPLDSLSAACRSAWNQRSRAWRHPEGGRPGGSVGSVRRRRRSSVCWLPAPACMLLVYARCSSFVACCCLHAEAIPPQRLASARPTPCSRCCRCCSCRRRCSLLPSIAIRQLHSQAEPRGEVARNGQPNRVPVPAQIPNLPGLSITLPSAQQPCPTPCQHPAMSTASRHLLAIALALLVLYANARQLKVKLGKGGELAAGCLGAGACAVRPASRFPPPPLPPFPCPSSPPSAGRAAPPSHP